MVVSLSGQGGVFSKKKYPVGIERIHANISFHLRQKKYGKEKGKQNKFLNFTDEKERNRK